VSMVSYILVSRVMEVFLVRLMNVLITAISLEVFWAAAAVDLIRRGVLVFLLAAMIELIPEKIAMATYLVR